MSYSHVLKRKTVKEKTKELLKIMKKRGRLLHLSAAEAKTIAVYFLCQRDEGCIPDSIRDKTHMFLTQYERHVVAKKFFNGEINYKEVLQLAGLEMQEKHIFKSAFLKFSRFREKNPSLYHYNHLYQKYEKMDMKKKERIDKLFDRMLRMFVNTNRNVGRKWIKRWEECGKERQEAEAAIGYMVELFSIRSGWKKHINQFSEIYDRWMK